MKIYDHLPLWLSPVFGSYFTQKTPYCVKTDCKKPKAKKENFRPNIISFDS